MSEDNGAEQPGQRTVAELLAQYGESASQSGRRRRRRAEDPSDTSPGAIIDRVRSDSGQLRAISDEAPAAEETAVTSAVAPDQQGAGDPSAPTDPSVSQPPGNEPPGGREPAEREQVNYWSRRLQRPTPEENTTIQPAPPAGGAPRLGNADATIQQPAMPDRPQAPQPPQAPQRPQAPQPPQTASVSGQLDDSEASTEQFLPVQPPYAEPDASPTALVDLPVLPPRPEPDGPPDYSYPGYGGVDLAADQDEYEDYDDFGPAHGRDPDSSDADEGAGSSAWLPLVLQIVAGLIAGGAVWLAFRWLWLTVPVGGLAAAVIASGVLVFIARKFSRSDVETVVLAVLVGLVCTVSPAAVMLVGH